MQMVGQCNAVNQIPMLLCGRPEFMPSNGRQVDIEGEFTARLQIAAERGNVKLTMQPDKSQSRRFIGFHPILAFATIPREFHRFAFPRIPSARLEARAFGNGNSFSDLSAASSISDRIPPIAPRCLRNTAGPSSRRGRAL
jgi:hypothetical protein